jgi:hypothetical protein
MIIILADGGAPITALLGKPVDLALVAIFFYVPRDPMAHYKERRRKN